MRKLARLGEPAAADRDRDCWRCGTRDGWRLQEDGASGRSRRRQEQQCCCRWRASSVNTHGGAAGQADGSKRSGPGGGGRGGCRVIRRAAWLR